MAEPEGIHRDENWGERAAAHPRAVGSPLPRGRDRNFGLGARDRESPLPAAPPLGRALGSGAPSSDAADVGPGLQRAMNALRSAIPFVQRLLPLLDGNFVTAITNVLTQQAAKPASTANLAPIHEGINELQIQHRELHDQVAIHSESIRKVEDQLTMVREATDRNTLEQQELMEDLRAVGTKVNFVALIALAMLGISVFLNLVLYLHIQRVLP